MSRMIVKVSLCVHFGCLHAPFSLTNLDFECRLILIQSNMMWYQHLSYIFSWLIVHWGNLENTWSMIICKGSIDWSLPLQLMLLSPPIEVCHTFANALDTCQLLVGERGLFHCHSSLQALSLLFIVMPRWMHSEVGRIKLPFLVPLQEPGNCPFVWQIAYWFNLPLWLGLGEVRVRAKGNLWH